MLNFQWALGNLDSPWNSRLDSSLIPPFSSSVFPLQERSGAPSLHCHLCLSFSLVSPSPVPHVPGGHPFRPVGGRQRLHPVVTTTVHTAHSLHPSPSFCPRGCAPCRSTGRPEPTPWYGASAASSGSDSVRGNAAEGQRRQHVRTESHAGHAGLYVGRCSEPRKHESPGQVRAAGREQNLGASRQACS